MKGRQPKGTSTRAKLDQLNDLLTEAGSRRRLIWTMGSHPVMPKEVWATEPLKCLWRSDTDLSPEVIEQWVDDELKLALDIQ